MTRTLYYEKWLTLAKFDLLDTVGQGTKGSTPMITFKLPQSRGLLSPEDIQHLERNKLLSSAEINPKTAKGLTKLPIVASLLHLAPAYNSGYGMCAMASVGCAEACLYRAGHGGIVKLGKSVSDVNEARIRKTRWFVEDHAAFMAKLAKEMQARVRKAARLGLTATFRLNATSDVPWERVPITVDGVTYPNVMTAFPAAIFYDYTKVITRLRGTLPQNYFLTFSLAESNDSHALEAIARGFNVAAVLRVRKGEPMPDVFAGLPVIDGDEHDYRFLDTRGVIVGLRPKGPAIRDTSGFVWDVDRTLDGDKRPTFHKRPTLTLAHVA